MYLQTQRLLGQQSLAEFVNLHVDIQKISLKNRARTNVIRKAGLVINGGDTPTKREVERKRAMNESLFGLKI